MDKLWLALAGAKRENSPTLEINHRPLATMGAENQTLAVSFTTLCVDARSQHDYIALSRLFHTVMLFDVPVMTRLMESEARRFIALVDEFYERHVKLVVSAEVPLYEIYQGDRLKFEFQRCLSRLQEMQSATGMLLTRPVKLWAVWLLNWLVACAVSTKRNTLRT